MKKTSTFLSGMSLVLLLLASSASATSITSPTGTFATPTIKAESEGHVALDSPIGEIRCNSTIEGEVKSHGSSVTAAASLVTFALTGCTEGWHFTTITPGTLEIHWTTAHNGTVTWTGGKFSTTFGGSTCVYGTNQTDFGTITGGTPATIDITANIPIIGQESSPICGTAPQRLTGSYKVSSPEALFVDAGVDTPTGSTITAPTGTVATPAIKAESEGHVTLDSPLGNVSCSSTIEGSIESHGVEVPASGKVSALSFTGCTEGWHVTVISKGSLEVLYKSSYNGTAKWSGAKFSTTVGGITCVYETSITDIGTVTGGTPATLDIEGKLPVVTSESSPFCGTQPTTWTGSYKLTSPETLFVDKGINTKGGTSITSPTGTVTTPTIKAESEGHVAIDNEGGSINCNSSIEGKVESHGSEKLAEGKVSSLSFSGCTDSWHVTTVTPGTLAIEWTSGYNGVLKSSGAKIDATRLGVTCVYATSNTNIGTLTGGAPATIDLEGSLPIVAGESSVVCGASAALTGSYKLSSPESLYVDAA